jgi:hypothetical protein
MDNIIENFQPQAGKHCVSNSLQQIFNYNNFDLSEEMIFGLAEGLNFFYFDYKNFDYPMIGGRTKLFEFEEKLAANLNIEIKVQKTTSVKKAYRVLKENIKNNNPLMVYADMGELDYLYLPEGYHFGGHSIVIFGLNESEDEVYLSDRDSEGFKVTMREEETPRHFHILSIDKIKQARNSKHKPYPPKNRWLEIDFTNFREPNKDMLTGAIRTNMETLIDPPIRNLGVKGIKKFAKLLVKDWQEFPMDKLKEAAFNSFIFINQIGGTGGGIFRKMYGDFLIEASNICKDNQLKTFGKRLKSIGDLWDEIGYRFFDVHQKEDASLLEEISEELHKIHEKEGKLFQEIEKHLNG